MVGWVDLRADDVERSLAELAPHPKFVGVRHVVQDEPDPRFLLGAEFLRGIGEAAQFGLTYDILIFPAAIARRPSSWRGAFPSSPSCSITSPSRRSRSGISRLAGADPRAGEVAERALQGLRHGHRSGPRRMAASGPPPYLETVFEAFGEERLMFGSDWPVCLLAASYERVLKVVEDFTASLSEEAAPASSAATPRASTGGDSDSASEVVYLRGRLLLPSVPRLEVTKPARPRAEENDRCAAVNDALHHRQGAREGVEIENGSGEERNP